MRLEGMAFFLTVLFAFTLISSTITVEAQRLGVVSKIPPSPGNSGLRGGCWSCWGHKVVDKKKGTTSVAAASPPQAIHKKVG
uniref:Uncharacterized protein n=1 Tax=Lactuca sativa TaxID=4236 RepID=A0A9R1UPY4_LACSA|nr:hypothetical protein LSAT_V11C800399020 [Lactuca sativa]